MSEDWLRERRVYPKFRVFWGHQRHSMQKPVISGASSRTFILQYFQWSFYKAFHHYLIQKKFVCSVHVQCRCLFGPWVLGTGPHPNVLPTPRAGFSHKQYRELLGHRISNIPCKIHVDIWYVNTWGVTFNPQTMNPFWVPPRLEPALSPPLPFQQYVCLLYQVLYPSQGQDHGSLLTHALVVTKRLFCRRVVLKGCVKGNICHWNVL